MKPVKGFEAAKVITDKEKLPVGGYILNILNAKEVTFKNGSSGLKISFDIAEGEYKGFYKNDYDNQTKEDKSWKGNLNLFIPKDDGSEDDKRTQNIFKTAISNIEESNNGYHWNWDETTLKNKKVGGVFRNKEWLFNGKTGFATECAWFTTVENIKNNKFNVPADKLLDQSKKPAYINADFEEITDQDLPF